jgi:hypothetical protein
VVDAQRWYEDCVEGLGVRFLDSLRATTERAARWPNAGTPARQGDEGTALERKVALPGFPYVAVYRVAGDNLEVSHSA